MDILQYESKIWATANLLRGCGIKESEWASFMMPFFALAMIESRLVRMFDQLKAEIGKEAFEDIAKDDLYASEGLKDPIEVYFDNQIGIVEVVAEEPEKKKKKPTEVAEPGTDGSGLFDVLKVIEARNKQEAKIGALIEEFEAKIVTFFNYVKASKEGERLIVKIRSHVSEDEIYDDFAKIYRRYKALKRKAVGEFFFKETEDLVDKLCDDFEVTVRDMKY